MASVYVRGFPKRTGERDLQKFFSQAGPVNQVRMVRDFAFIIFKDKENARSAVTKMNGQTFDGATLTVQLSKERSGPQPNDVCRNCGKKGHWQTSCPSKNKRRRDRSSSDSSRSRSRSSREKQKQKKHKKSSKKKSKKRQSSSGSSSDSSSSSSRSRSRSRSNSSSYSEHKKKRR